MSDTYNSPACQAARDLCIERKGVCGRDCPNALESMRWKCKIRETPEVAVAIGKARYLERAKARKSAAARRLWESKEFSKRQVFAILDALEAGARGVDLAKQHGVTDSTISLIKKGVTYRGFWLEWHEKNGKQAG